MAMVPLLGVWEAVGGGSCRIELFEMPYEVGRSLSPADLRMAVKDRNGERERKSRIRESPK